MGHIHEIEVPGMVTRLGSESNFLEETMNITDMVKRKFDSDPNLVTPISVGKNRDGMQ